MLVRKNKKAPFIIVFIVFILIFYYMLRVTTLVSNNNGSWSLDFFSTVFNELYKINTPIDITSENLMISTGVSFFILMIYESYHIQNKKNIQENTYRFCGMVYYKGYCKQKR